jgi:ubiquinol-cytochrome c reductase cytochrome b subunit
MALRETVRSWWRQFWADLKAGTDPGLLGVLRFFGFLYGPIDRTLPIDGAFRKALRYRLPSYVGWRHAFGGIVYVLFLVLVVTGVLLSFYYRPSAQEAHQSVQYIVTRVSFGWLVRDVHVWSANFIVVALLVHMARVYFEGAYKPPRETTWLVGLLLFFVVLLFGATGYLLPWDQWAYWTVTEGLDALARVPLVGGLVARLWRGDVWVSGATLSRFFAFHVIVLPWLALALLGFHFALVRRHGIAPPPGAAVDPERARAEGVPFYPHHLLRSFMVSVLVLALVVTAALLFPRPIAEPADPAAPPAELVSTWVVVDAVRGLLLHVGVWGFAAFLLFGIGLALLPLLDRRPERRISRRPVATVLGVIVFGSCLLAWLAGQRVRSVPPSPGLRPAGVVEERAVPAPPSRPLPQPGLVPPAPAPGTRGRASRGRGE